MLQKTPAYRIIRPIALILLLLWTAFPVLFLFMSAFKHPSVIFKFPPSLLFKPTLVNFTEMAREWPSFFRSLRNSAIIAAGASLLTILISAPAGYALSRHRNGFLQGSAFFMLAVRMYPPIVITVPLFPIMAQLGLVDSHFILILLYSTFYVSLCTWLMKTYMDEVPVELEEAAAIDGANAFQRVTRIMIPLSIHGLVATAIFVTIFAWKEYTFAYIFAGTRVYTAPILLHQMLSPVTGVSFGPLFAAATIQLLPILIFIWLVQSYLVKGLRTGAVKG
jgi:multiple sugar transport system permease protein